jgi:hypothetical protein
MEAGVIVEMAVDFRGYTAPDRLPRLGVDDSEF